MSGGGGKTPSNTTQTTSTIPKFAEPYATNMMGQASALTNINQNPYQSYTGQRVAGATPLMEQSYGAIGNMQPSALIGQGADMARQAGLGALNTGSFDQAAADKYMSPYMQSVVGMQQRDAQRQADIAHTGQQAQAARSGALGGSRNAIVQAEANRNLANQMGNIQATGLQNAWQQAQSQYNADQGRQMQGYGIAGQAAGTMGQLGQHQYGQQMGIANAQNVAGTQQQDLAQQNLNVPYQEFLNAQNYPYKQLGFMSDVLHGLPTQTSSTMYQAPPNTWGQAAGLAAGLGSLFMSGQGG